MQAASYLCSMFYRRKIILALLQLFENELEKVRLQKLLFLFTRKQQKPTYDFIPYKFGCYSFSANADLSVMARRNILTETENQFKCNDQANYLHFLKEVDRRLLQEVKALYGEMNSNALMKYTYVNYPYYATRSVKAESILNEHQLKKVKDSLSVSDRTILFTIGYEGISLEEYLNRLIKNDIRMLIDVRNNPKSMKYGFSKGLLQKNCENLGIRYLHFPEVGIQSEQRRELKVQSDYDNLFKAYKETNLPRTQSSQIAILNLLKEYNRIALTCFEANINQCHRKHLAEAIGNLPAFQYEVKHILK